MNDLRRFVDSSVFVIVVVTILVAVIGCGKQEPIKIRRVILVVIDTLRSDYLGCAGGPVATPTMDQLAERGIRFSQVRSHCPITGPSHSSLFTGLNPSEHGVLNNTQILDERFTTLAERFQIADWTTAAFVSLGVLRKSFGMGQGFDTYNERVGNLWYRNAGRVNKAVFPVLQELAEKERFFLWVHYSDPHEPYAAPGRPYPTYKVVQDDGAIIGEVEADGEFHSIPVDLSEGERALTLEPSAEGQDFPNEIALEQINSIPRGFRFEPGPGMQQGPQGRGVLVARPPATLRIISDTSQTQHIELRFRVKQKLSADRRREEYGHEVEYVDRELGVLVDHLEASGLLEDSVLIVTSDHGEGLGDHGLFEHTHQLFDSLLNVPLIIVAPGVLEPGSVVHDPVSLVDLFPTILELCELPVPAPIRGRSLLPLMQGKPIPRLPHIALTSRPQASSNLEAVVADNLKLIRQPDENQIELFNLATDPGELINIAADRPADANFLQSELGEVLSTSERNSEWDELDEETVEMLEALGYVHQEARAEAEENPLKRSQ